MQLLLDLLDVFPVDWRILLIISKENLNVLCVLHYSDDERYAIGTKTELISTILHLLQAKIKQPNNQTTNNNEKEKKNKEAKREQKEKFNQMRIKGSCKEIGSCNFHCKMQEMLKMLEGCVDAVIQLKSCGMHYGQKNGLYIVGKSRAIALLLFRPAPREYPLVHPSLNGME